MNASNSIFWSRHVYLTIKQPTLNFKEYPNDEQTIHLRYGSYAFNQTYLQLLLLAKAVTFNQNYDGSDTFKENPLWIYDNDGTTYDVYISSSGFTNAIYNIGMLRDGSGIVVRLILPATLLILLGGLTFWSNYEGRVDSTITLLLAVSALYIVIIANIPLVGYLTLVDEYIFWVSSYE